MGVGQKWPNGHLVFICLDAESVFVVVFVVLSGSLFVDYTVLYYLLTHPVSLNLQQNSKKRQSDTSAVYYSV